MDVAAPLLERHGCPASFYLTGAGLDGPHGFWWQRLQTAPTVVWIHAPSCVGAACARPEIPLVDLASDIEHQPPDIRERLSEALGQLIGADSTAYRLSRTQVGALAREGSRSASTHGHTPCSTSSRTPNSPAHCATAETSSKRPPDDH